MCLPSCTALGTPRLGSPAYKEPGQGKPSIGADSRCRPAVWIAYGREPLIAGVLKWGRDALCGILE